MAELLVKAIDATHPDPVIDRQGCYKRGMLVVVMPDGHPWGFEERRPTFVVIKIPLIPVDRVQKYIEQWMAALGQLIQRRRWRIRWNDLPLAAQNTLRDTGVLTIKATDLYTGPFEYTWAQVKAFFRNDETGLDETEDP